MLSQIVRICSGACSTRHVDVPCTKNMKTYVLAVTDTAYRSWHKLKGAAACRRELGGPCSADGTSAGHTVHTPYSELAFALSPFSHCHWRTVLLNKSRLLIRQDVSGDYDTRFFIYAITNNLTSQQLQYVKNR